MKKKLGNQNDHERIFAQIADADVVVFAVPLYVDRVPSHVLAFLKEMERFCREKAPGKTVYVLSNGGFIEGKQNAALMQVCETFCIRSGLQWGGGIGVGGGVMLNVLKIMFFVQIFILLLSIVLSGLQNGAWLPADALLHLRTQVLVIAFFNLSVFFYALQMGIAIRKRRFFGEKYTRILLPSFVFILFADLFFAIISLFQVGVHAIKNCRAAIRLLCSFWGL